MSENKKEKFPSTFTIDNFSSTAELTKNDYKLPIGSVDTITEKEYNPYEHRPTDHPNTFSGALMHMLKSSLGTGILAIPHAIAAAGIVTGAVGTVLVGMLCTHTIHLLVFASQEMCKKCKVPTLGFADTAYAVFQHGTPKLKPHANKARLFVDIALMLTYYAGNAVYVVFIAGNLQELIFTDWDTRLYMAILLLPLAICCQIRQLKNLVPFSIIANCTMIAAFGITLYYMFNDVQDADMSDRKLFNSITEFPRFFSTVLFAMEGIGTMLPIENSMLRPQFIGCPGVLNWGMLTVTTLYTILGVFGYVTYGSKLTSNLIQVLDPTEIPAKVAKGCISVAVFFTFMLQFSVPCDITWKKLRGYVPDARQNIAQSVLRVLLVTMVVGIAVVVPKLDAIIGLVGSVFFSILGLFIPAGIDIVLNMGDDGDFGCMKWKLVKNILIMALSLFGLFSGSYFAILDLQK